MSDERPTHLFKSVHGPAITVFCLPMIPQETTTFTHKPIQVTCQLCMNVWKRDRSLYREHLVFAREMETSDLWLEWMNRSNHESEGLRGWMDVVRREINERSPRRL